MISGISFYQICIYGGQLKKRAKKSIVLIAAIGITAFLAFYIPNASSIKGRDGYKSDAASVADTISLDDTDSGAEVSSKALAGTETESANSGGAGNYIVDSSNNSTVSVSDSTSSNTSTTGEDKEPTIDVSGGTSNGKTEKEVEPYSQEWVDKRIEDHKDEIDEDDLKNFRYIVNKLGAGKVAAYFEGGLSQEDQKELYSYMRSVLTDSEYDSARQLFIEYNWLLYEE